MDDIEPLLNDNLDNHNPDNISVISLIKYLFTNRYIGVNSSFTFFYAIFCIISSFIDVNKDFIYNAWLFCNGLCLLLCQICMVSCNTAKLPMIFLNTFYMLVYFISVPLSIYALTAWHIININFKQFLVIISFLFDTIKFLWWLVNWRSVEFFDYHQIVVPQSVTIPESIEYSTLVDPSLNSCVICIEDFKPHDICIVLSCEHIYHKDCVVPWIESNNTCPICRVEIS